MPAPSAESELVRRYAAFAGVSVRTAQRHAKPSNSNHRKFRSFCGDELPSTEVQAELVPVDSPGEVKPPADRTGTAWRVWQMWKAASDSFERETDPVLKMGWARIAKEQRTDYYKALREDEEERRKESRRVDVSDLEVFVVKFLNPLGQKIQELDTKVARTDDERGRIRSWLEKEFQPAVVEMIDELRGMAAAA